MSAPVIEWSGRAGDGHKQYPTGRATREPAETAYRAH
jgi:hypothetical protein